jgi:LmbE family N-acetylglucosaminyl deacetylase
VPDRDLKRFKNVLAVFPHADDETVTCGGSLRRFADAGARVTLLILTRGERGNPTGSPDPALESTRHREAESAADYLGVVELIQQDFGDGRLRLCAGEVGSYLSRLLGELRPDLVLAHDLAGLDGHDDHIASSEIVTALHAAEPRFTLWYVTLPAWLTRFLKVIGQMATSQQVDARRAIPTHRIFLGAATVPKIRAWYAYRSQRGAIAKGLGRLVPAWLAVSLQQFEYFAEAP